MMNRKLLCMVLWVVGCLIHSSLLFAANMNFMANTAMQYFNDQDWKLLDNASDKALNNYPNGKKLFWKNPDNNHSGYVQPIKSTSQNGRTCRILKIVGSDGSQTDLYQFNFCKINGVWKIDVTNQSNSQVGLIKSLG